jgi:hypothetical protein
MYCTKCCNFFTKPEDDPHGKDLKIALLPVCYYVEINYYN